MQFYAFVGIADAGLVAVIVVVVAALFAVDVAMLLL